MRPLRFGLSRDRPGAAPTEGRYLIVSNHQSSVDIPALVTVFSKLNLKFVAMRQLESGAPTVSLALRNGGFAFVGGRGPKQDLATIREFSHQLDRHDGSAVIFPEGMRSEGGELRHLAGKTMFVRIGEPIPFENGEDARAQVERAGRRFDPHFRRVSVRDRAVMSTNSRHA